MPETIGGLPLHPLIVHATVVIVPLAALAVLLYAFVPRFRAWSGILTPATALAAMVLAPLSTSTGEGLEHMVEETALVETHAELGETLLPLSFVRLAQLSGQRHPRADRPAADRAGRPSVFPPLDRCLPGLGVLAAVVTVSTHAVNRVFRWVMSSSSRPEPISTRNCSRTVRKNRSIFPRPAGCPGRECTRRIPSTAQARASCLSIMAEPLSLAHRFA